MSEGVPLVIQTVKLAKLRLSPINVRTAPEKELAIEPMAADIEARGVLQNLLVTPARPRGTFEVFDGGRRLRGLLLLAERGTIDPEVFDVPVLVLKDSDAALSETSLAANFHQLKLTPAEECRAFQHFLGVDGDVDAVAKRFGQTRRFIEQRLRLANLADPIFDALAAGELTLDLAKAYASTENREKQLLIYNSYSQHSYINADAIRRAIANETMKANDPIAQLVGEAAYVAAGGAVDRDLFSEGGDRWVNPEIAQRLGGEQMEAEAKRIGEETGLAWIRPIATAHTYNAAAGLYRVMLPQLPFSDEERARVDEIDARLEAIQAAMDDEETTEDAFSLLDAEYDGLDEERRALHDRPSVLPDALRPLVGAFLTLTARGEMLLDTAYYSERSLRLDANGGVLDDAAPREEPDGNDTSGIGGSGGGEAAAPRPDTVAPGGKALSMRLFEELAMQRRDVLAANLIQHPALALDYAIFVMIDGRKQCLAKHGSTIRASSPQDPVVGEQPVTSARTYLAQAHEALDAGWTEPADPVARFEAFRDLDDDSKAGWLAYIVAASLEAKDGYGAVAQNALQNRLATIMDIDVAAWWRPTSVNFFDRVPKAALLSLLHDVGGPAVSGRYAAAKKPDISSSCEKLFAGEAMVEAEVKEAALKWVPDAMRFLDTAPVEPLRGEEVDGPADADLQDHAAGQHGELLVEEPEEMVAAA
jgi:ParB family chromosome partitioning protein